LKGVLVRVISVRNLSKHFNSGKKTIKVLKKINVDVDKGDKIVIIGPSGSGKSTFLRCINGLDSPTGGEILFEGKCITNKSCNMDIIRRQIGMVFQHFNLFPHLTILQNIILAPVFLKVKTLEEAQEEARRLLIKVDLLDKMHEYPIKLSGGQKQRAAIVRALAMDPKVILFDEPTSALDPEMIGEVLDVMGNLAKNGITMLVVTHEMNFAREVATRVLFMDNGEIIADAPPKEIFENSQNERVEELLTKIL
jgi:polar amino acid transport system ATP-binding protein